MKKAIRDALAAYQSGECAQALALLEPYNKAARPDPGGTLEEALDRMDAMAPHERAQSAVLDWVALACDRLRQELGKQEIAVVPVPMALNTALSLLD